jgi:hypothetical protein
MGPAFREGLVRRGIPPAHRATTVELRTLYPFVVPEDLGVDGCYIGREASGSLFCFDPWECYAKGKLTSPNMVVFGQIGRGKSAFVKSFVWRERCFGRHCWVLDPKGEYGALAAASGATPLRLGPGLGLRLNPLDVGPAGAPAARPGTQSSPVPPPLVQPGQLPVPPPVQPGQSPAHQRRAELLGALLGSSLGRPLLPQERAAADVALSVAEERTALPTLPLVAEALLRPEERQARLLGTDLDGLRQDGRQVALELRRLVHGDLAGMFDGETSPGLDLSAGVVVLDLSRLYASPALGLLMVCALSWLQSTLVVGSATKRLVVLDEAWALLSHLATARWLQATFKLSRSYGVANVAVVHRLSDLKAAGQEGSEQQRLAEGLLADAETRVVFGQAPGEAARAGELLGLSRNEQALVCQLPRGVALWRVGQSSFLVEHELCPEELALADTDAAMRADPPADELTRSRRRGTLKWEG